MNKYFKFLSVAGVALLAAACSNDEPKGGDNGTGEGEVAYLKVRINYADGGRASDGGFEFGKDFEHNVTTGRFFFYDEAGNYVAHASVWNGGYDNPVNPDNVEYFGNNVLVLSGLDNNNFPKYMLTVLNAPAGFESEMTLQATADKIFEQALTATDGGIFSGDNFIMSTSSYGRTEENEPAFVTVLNTSNFKNSAAEAQADANVVDVYVERLAAKVCLGVDESQLTKDEATGMYKLKVSVSGNPNDVTDVEFQGATDLYIRFDGWALSNTRKGSHLCKDIASVTPGLAYNWDNAARGFHRSWWGASVGYGQAVNEGDLNYFSYNELGKKLYNEMPEQTDNATYKTFVDYCAENTNTAEFFNSGKTSLVGKELVNPSVVTSVLVKATVCNADGEGVDLILYNGLYFTETAFRDYGMRYAQSISKLNYYTFDGTNYNQLSADFAKVESVEGSASDVNIVADAEAFAGKTIYVKNEDGTYADVDDNATVIAAVSEALAEVEGATGYKGGAMYYNIPVEHLYDATGNTLEECEYGVVRNHFYQLSITSIARLGHGVYDPDQDIIPDEPEDPKYYVGARINILSWKVVKQNVDL